MQNRSLYHLTGRAWLLSIILSATLMTALFLLEESTFKSHSNMYNKQSLFDDIEERISMFGTIGLMHFLFGLPILFLSYLGFSQLKRLKLKEYIVRPIMIAFSILLITGTMFSIFGISISHFLEGKAFYMMVFATTFILMTQDQLIEDISEKEG